MEIKRYNFKVIKCGNITEIYAYEIDQFKTLKVLEIESEEEVKQAEELVKKSKEIKSVSVVHQLDEDYVRRKETINQIKKKLKRLVNSNVGQYNCSDKFLTLTFEGEPPTREEVVHRFKMFTKKFRRIYNDKFEYIGVIERGENGTQRLHMHVICFNLPYIDKTELEEIWGYGYIDIQEIDEVGGVADYMVKYIDKTLEGNYVPKGKRFYFPSRGLKKPIEYFLDDDNIDDFADDHNLDNLAYEFQFDSQFVGHVRYMKFVAL